MCRFDIMPWDCVVCGLKSKSISNDIFTYHYARNAGTTTLAEGRKSIGRFHDGRKEGKINVVSSLQLLCDENDEMVSKVDLLGPVSLVNASCSSCAHIELPQFSPLNTSDILDCILIQNFNDEELLTDYGIDYFDDVYSLITCPKCGTNLNAYKQNIFAP